MKTMLCSSRILRRTIIGLGLALTIAAGPLVAATTPVLKPPSDPSAAHLLISAAVPTAADEAAVQPKELVVGAGKSLILELGSSVTRVSMANPSVADTVVISPTQILINGLVPGSTSLVMWFESGSSVFYDLTVMIDTKSLGEHLKAFFPHEDIAVGTSKGTLVLNGTVSNPEIGERAAQIATEYSGNVINNMTYPESGRSQVALKIIFAEVDKEAITDLSAAFTRIDPNNPRGGNELLVSPGDPGSSGNFINDPRGPDFNFTDAINLYAFNLSDTITGLITALKTRGQLQILAEPTLMAADGEEASFLAGGEYPIPVAQAGAGFTSVTIIYKKFGISLDFKPSIRNQDTIVLRVQPEVSALDFANAVTLSGFRVPALRVRRADTEIELKNGQSFAIAGLYSADLQQTKKKIPILGDIPLLGYLFRSKSLQKRKSELLVIATPTIVYPNPPGMLPEIPQFDIDMEIDKEKKEKATEEVAETKIQDLSLETEEEISAFLKGYEEPVLIDPDELFTEPGADETLPEAVPADASGKTYSDETTVSEQTITTGDGVESADPDQTPAPSTSTESAISPASSGNGDSDES